MYIKIERDKEIEREEEREIEGVERERLGETELEIER